MKKYDGQIARDTARAVLDVARSAEQIVRDAQAYIGTPDFERLRKLSVEIRALHDEAYRASGMADKQKCKTCLAKAKRLYTDMLAIGDMAND